MCDVCSQFGTFLTCTITSIHSLNYTVIIHCSHYTNLQQTNTIPEISANGLYLSLLLNSRSNSLQLVTPSINCTVHNRLPIIFYDNLT